jgi:5'-3' exonuclease
MKFSFSVVLILSLGFSVSSFRPIHRFGPLHTLTSFKHAPSPSLGKATRSPSGMQLNGIPKLFRWLTDLYPLVLETVDEGLGSNDAAVDNFYLDMNGIIHTCTHSNNDKLVALNEKDMFLRIFAYTDRLYKLVKPSRKMYLAIDGVAPRAKMNQQRSRRFRSAKEREALIAEHVAKEGKMLEDESFDSNCITPGTEFMFRLGIAFHRWVEYKMKTDPFWQNGAEIIFSGPDVPGEGEHKIMDLIREERAKDPGYFRGKYKHCLYGLDADLIMLSLVTHEPFFVLLREKIVQGKRMSILDSPGAAGGAASAGGGGRLSALEVKEFKKDNFECLDVAILRKMLKQHFHTVNDKLSELKAVSSTSARSHTGSRASNTAPSVQQMQAQVQVQEAGATRKVDAHSQAAREGSPVASAAATRTASNECIPFQSGFSLERIINDFVLM